jgi:rod shape-determining protein MreC
VTVSRRPDRARRLTQRQRLAAAVLVAVAIVFLTIDLTGSGLRGAHGGVRGALGALYRGTDGVLGPVRRFVQGVPQASSNRDTIARLRHENAQLRARLVQDAADAATNAALSRLPSTSVPARVIALGPGSGFDWTVTLDVGSHNGVHDGQTVTDGVGLVGRVLHTSGSSCMVLLAADPGSGVGARDTRTGELALATGQGTSGFQVSPLNPTARLSVGDQLITGPAGASTYVPGLALGTVTSVRTSAGGLTVAQLQPAVSPTSLDIVGVITTAPQAQAAR